MEERTIELYDTVRTVSNHASVGIGSIGVVVDVPVEGGDVVVVEFMNADGSTICLLDLMVSDFEIVSSAK